MAVVSGRKTVTTAGTAVPLSTASVAIREIRIDAETDNTNPVTVGDSTVVGALATRKGIALAATDPPLVLRAEDGWDDLADIWIDAITNTEGVTFTYTTDD